MSHNITIEKMRPEDVPAVVDLQRLLMPIELTDAQITARYEKILANDDYALLIARMDGAPVATATAICCHALAEDFLAIEDVVVKDGLTGQGIGGMLMDAADDFARSKGCAYAILVSSGFRKDAHRFYEKHGYEEDVRGFRKSY